MHDAHEFLRSFAIVLGVAAVTTVVFQRLKQPVVLGYILAGLVVGPHVPLPLVADAQTVRTLSELGVILLMFSLGLEFSIRKLVSLGPTAALTSVIQTSVMVWLGYVVGRAFGWTAMESVFTGALIAISSTTIIAKVFDDRKVRGRLRELVVGVLIVEDLIAILMMTVLTALASGGGLSASTLVGSSARLLAFLAAVLVAGFLLVPRAIRYVAKLGRPETMLVASVGICFALALLAQELGYSVALGAFIAGSLIAESGEGAAVEHLIVPVRDLFGAVFFVSVGLMIDPALVAQHWGAVLVLTVVVIAGKVAGVTLGAFLTGNGVRTSVQAGMSLAQIGEFSFIIAGLGLSLGATGQFLYPIAVAVSAVTTLTTPWLIERSGPAASWLDSKLPRPLQTFAALYGTWVEQLGRSPKERTSAAASVRRLFKLLFLDAALLAGLVIGSSVAMPSLAAVLMEAAGFGASAAWWTIVLGTVALSAPFVLGVLRIARSLGLAMATAALPAAEGGGVDLASAPRRALVVMLQLAVVLLVALPLAALTQPFLPTWTSAIALLALLALLAIVFARSATALHGHTRAGAELVVEALAAQSAAPARAAEIDLERLVPGLGHPTPLHLSQGSPAIGRTLADLDLRGLTGASVLAISRDGAGVVVPTAREILREGDTLALIGTEEAVSAARSLLDGR